MYIRNSGLEDREILQNQFAAYVKRAVHNKRVRFLQDENDGGKMEVSLTELELYMFDPHDEISAIFERELLGQALLKVQKKERYVLISRAIDGKSIDEIAADLGISYRAVTSILYRVKRKLREFMEEGEAK